MRSLRVVALVLLTHAQRSVWLARGTRAHTERLPSPPLFVVSLFFAAGLGR